jgi:hypothetical protein
VETEIAAKLETHVKTAPSTNVVPFPVKPSPVVIESAAPQAWGESFRFVVDASVIGEMSTGYPGYDSVIGPEWTPYLYQNTTPIFPWIGKPGYNLTTDMADEAIKYMSSLNAAAPDQPFFVLVGLAAHEAVEILESHADRPLVKVGSRRAVKIGRRVIGENPLTGEKLKHKIYEVA